jgi:putative hemolysin
MNIATSVDRYYEGKARVETGDSAYYGAAPGYSGQADFSGVNSFDRPQQGVGADDVCYRVIEPLFLVGEAAVSKPVNSAWPGIRVPLANGEIAFDLVSLASRQVPFEIHGEGCVSPVVPEADPFGIGSSASSMCADYGGPSSRRRISLRCGIISEDPGWFALVASPLIEKRTEPLCGTFLGLVNPGSLEEGL